ncbi:MFS transporter [Halobellus salinus]|uniref:MFS transporter n=1 Tax=Halobellus salinus TaxID=931585 RepID=A0A830ETW8_9EURY|nr:MFS transporter [Halobellus salinus]GGJ09440.1 MFS transporter [Halobellus salinus]SMP27444.1 Predicted arabinose efflux permease, MFS family [Halobellus salinus]
MSRGRLFGTLCSVVFLVNLARVIFAPLLQEFMTVFSVGEGTAGLIATLAWLGSAALRLPTGWVLTRLPRHHVILATGGILTGAAAFIASATSVAMVGLGALLLGLSSGTYFVAANPLVSELYPDRVGRAMGIHGMSSQVAAVGAAPLVTLVLTLVSDWRVVFVCVSVAAAVATLTLFLTARAADLPDAGGDDTDILGAVRSEWRIALVGVTIVGTTGFVWQGLFNFYELYMGTKGLDTATARNLLTVVFGAGVPAFFVSGRLADRLPRVPYLLSIVGSFAGCLLLLTLVDGFGAILLVTAAIGYVIHSLFPAIDTYLLDALPDDSRASAYAWYSAGMMAVQATGSSAVGQLREVGIPYDVVFTRLGFGLGVVVVGLAVLQRRGALPE